MTRITTDAVLDAIKAHAEQMPTFTTVDIARAMGVEEYPVRAAFSWLCRYRLIEIIEGTTCIRRTRRAGEAYTASMYKLKPAAAPADFDALYRVLGLGVKA